MVDEERVTRLAVDVRRDITRLRDLGRTTDLLHRPDQLDAVKYRFVTAIEGCVSIAHHLVASEGWAAPESNAAAVTELADHGVLDPELGATMARASGFRNILVHQYGSVDDPAVIRFLDRLDDLEAFVRQVLAWLAGREVEGR